MKYPLNIYRLMFRMYKMMEEKRNVEHGITLEDVLLTRTEVKEFLKISESTYKRLVKAGIIIPYRFPGGDRILKKELLRQIEKTRYVYKLYKSNY